MSEGQLPFTGAGITVGGLVMDQLGLLIVGILLVAVGAAILRLRFRPGKTINTI